MDIEKIKNYLQSEDGSYRDNMKEEILFYLFEMCDGELDHLGSLFVLSWNELHKRIDLTISKMILHEHESGLYEIIEEYLMR